MIQNANLRELRAQATRWAYIQDWKTHAERTNIETRRYGELILKKCLEFVDELDHGSGDEWDQSLRVARDNIVEYFGVEE